jgi:transposase
LIETAIQIRGGDRIDIDVLQSNRGGWTPKEFWETYMQLAVAEKAFRVLKSELRLRPVWHQYSGRVQAHVFVCVLAYALWKTLDHLAKQAGLMTLIHKPAERRYGRAVPKPRPMTPEVILRELGRLQIGDIILETTDGRQLLLRRVERPDAEQKRILAALKMELPERLSPDRLL